MIGLFQRARRSVDGGELTSTHGRLIYAVGDIHGRADLLVNLVSLIVEDCKIMAVNEPPALILLGDYIDRGPSSRQVIDAIIALGRASDFEIRTLKGNHEAILGLFLDDPGAGPGWIKAGGRPTLLSYDVQPPSFMSDGDGWTAAQKTFKAQFPPEHLAFIQSLELYAEYGDYIFVHAGLKPGQPLESQTERDLLWIRDEFFNADGRRGKTVVHGHTPAPEPHLSAHRIGIDTGAYATGVLTAVRLLDTSRYILQASLTCP